MARRARALAALGYGALDALHLAVAEDSQVALSVTTDERFEHHTLELLRKKFGPYGMARFLRTFRCGTVDYTRDRHKWLDGLTVDDILNEPEKRP